MSLLDKFKEFLKEKYYALREGLQLTESVDDIIKKIPIPDLEANYYYDFVKDELVSKESIGIELAEQSKVYLALENEKSDYRQKGKLYTSQLYEIKAGKSYDVDIDLPYFVNHIDIKFYSDNTSRLTAGYYIIERESSYDDEIFLEEYVYQEVNSIRQVRSFFPLKKFQLSFFNSDTSYSCYAEFTFFYSEKKLDTEASYTFYIKSGVITSRSISFSRPNNLFNSLSLHVNAGGTIACTLYITPQFLKGLGFEFGKTQTYTISGANNYSNTFYYPECNSLIIEVSTSSALFHTVGINVFFSKNKLLNYIDGQHFYALNGFTDVGTYVYGSSNGAYAGLMIICPETRSDWRVVVAWMSSTIKTYAGYISVGVVGHGEAHSEVNVFNALSMPLTASAGIIEYHTEYQTSFTARKGDIVRVRWGKQDSNGTLYLFGFYIKPA